MTYIEQSSLDELERRDLSTGLKSLFAKDGYTDILFNGLGAGALPATTTPRMKIIGAEQEL